MLLRLKQWQWWQLCMCTTLVQILSPQLCLSIKRPSLCWGCARFGPLRSQPLHNWVLEKRKKKRLVWWARRNILQGQFREGKRTIKIGNWAAFLSFLSATLFEHNMGGRILKLIVWKNLPWPDFQEDKYTNNWAQFSILIIIRTRKNGQKQPRPVCGKTKREFSWSWSI